MWDVWPNGYPDQNTGYEPNFFGHLNEEHTPINLPDSFQCRDDATIISAADDPDVLCSGASSSSKQTASSRVPTMLGSLGASPWKQRSELVDSRARIQATGADVGRESVVSTIFSTQSKGKRDRDQNFVHPLRDRENLQKSLERKVDSAVRGERMAQQKLYEAEADVEPRNCKKKKVDISLQEIDQKFESQRFQLHQASRWAGQAHRDKRRLYGKLELRNRLFQEDHARDCQKFKRICCEETDRARKARIDELPMHQERNPTTVSQLMAQIRESQNRANSLSVVREFLRS